MLCITHRHRADNVCKQRIAIHTSWCQAVFLKCASLPGNELSYFQEWEIEQSCLFALR